ncbi:hypothetical protein HMPREF1267_02384 [Corynebacterium sp. KPL1824]|nr:hypothetical protein HMPREF1267_02384 [Corynebacterium sp. KPL1824]
MSRWKVDRRVISYPRRRVIWAACCDGKKRIFATWRGAMAYADQRARTIEVTLPRYPLPLEIPGEEGDTTIVVEHQSEEDSVSIKDDFQDDTILLRRFELQPLALALLAEAQYGEQACPR